MHQRNESGTAAQRWSTRASALTRRLRPVRLQTRAAARAEVHRVTCVTSVFIAKVGCRAVAGLLIACVEQLGAEMYVLSAHLQEHLSLLNASRLHQCRCLITGVGVPEMLPETSLLVVVEDTAQRLEPIVDKLLALPQVHLRHPVPVVSVARKLVSYGFRDF